jgi:hypothetical protein
VKSIPERDLRVGSVVAAHTGAAVFRAHPAPSPRIDATTTTTLVIDGGWAGR